MESHGEQPHLIPYRVFIYVWLALIVLTGITVGVQYTDLAHMAIITAILIAVVKSTLVLMYFMHLRFERMIFTTMILAVILTYAIFVILTFADYYYR